MSTNLLSVRRFLKDSLPPRFLERTHYVRRYLPAKLRHIGFLRRLHHELRRSHHPKGRLTSVPRHPSGRAAPRITVLFFPDYPGDKSMAFNLCARLGYIISTDPSGRWDVAFKWRDNTFFDPTLLDWLPREIPMINRDSIDISKTAVDAAMHEVFGYSARVDPTRYEGPAVQKSDLNGRHDGKVIQCPVPQESLRPEYVYQRLIDNSLSADIVCNVRVQIHGTRIPLIALIYRRLEGRFGAGREARLFRTGGHSHYSDPHEVFSEDEIRSILAFTSHTGLDFGALDVLRDNANGRIYIVDANNTAMGLHRRVPRAVGDRLEQSFEQLVREWSRRDSVWTPS